MNKANRYSIISIIAGLIFIGIIGSTVDSQAEETQKPPESYVYLPVISSDTNSDSAYQMIQEFQAKSPEINKLIEEFKYPSWLATKNNNKECMFIYSNGVVWEYKLEQKQYKQIRQRNMEAHELANSIFKGKTCHFPLDITKSFDEAKKEVGITGCILDEYETPITLTLFGMPDCIIILTENDGQTLYGVGWFSRDIVQLSDGQDVYTRQINQINNDAFIKFKDEWIANRDKTWAKNHAKALQEENRRTEKIRAQYVETLTAIMKKAEQMKGSTLVFKGLYLGMPLEDARFICRKNNLGPYIMQNKQDESSYSFYMDMHDSKIFVNKDNNVEGFAFRKEAVNKLFNVSDMSAEQFKDTFCKSYNIRMQIEDRGFGSGAPWTHTSSSGLKVEIWQSKQLNLKSVPKPSERKFD